MRSGIVMSEAKILRERIIQAVVEYREAVEPSHVLESWNADASGSDGPTRLKEEAARVTAEHRRDVKPDQTVERILEISHRWDIPPVMPSDALETLFILVNQVAESFTRVIRLHYNHLVSYMDQILGLHLEKNEILSCDTSCAEYYGIRRRTPTWLEGLDDNVDSGQTLERRLAGIIDACGRRLDCVMAATRAPASGGSPGQSDGQYREFYRYPDLHKSMSEWCSDNTGPDGEEGHAGVIDSLEVYRRNLDSALHEYHELMKKARDAIRDDYPNENIKSEIDDIVKFEARNPNVYGLARWVEEHADFKAGGAAARLVADANGALEAFRDRTDPEGALSLTAEIDREAGAFVKRMDVSPDMVRFATDAYEMVCKRISGLDEPGALSWTMQKVADMLARGVDLDDSDRGQLSDAVANAVTNYFTPARLPVGRGDLSTEDADIPKTLRPLIKDVRAIVAKVPRAKRSRDTMLITRRMARDVAKHYHMQNS